MDIIWLNGWGSNSRVWNSLSANLPEYTHSFPSYRSIEKATDFRGMLESILLGRKAVLIGWSLGGMLAIEAAYHCSEQVIGLVGVDTTVCFVHPDRALGWPERVIRRMKKKLAINANETLSNFITSMFSKNDTDLGLAAYYHQLVTNDKVKIDDDLTTEALIAGLEYLEKYGFGI